MTNMTYAQAIDNALEIINTALATDPEMFENMGATVEKLEALKAQLAKRGSAKTPTKTQKANEEVKAVIADVLADTGAKMTVTEMIADDRLNGYTNQKISALLRQMVETGKVVKTLEGKKAYFAVAVE